jgi:hypothetical protein
MDQISHATATYSESRRSVLRENIEVEGEGSEIGAA